MLPRVSAALTQFIAPLTSSGRQAIREKPDPKGFQRHPSQKQQEQKNPNQGEDPGQVIPFPQQQPPPQAQPTGPPTAQLSVAHAFIQLLSRFQAQRGTLMKWLGGRTYQAIERNQKSSSRFKKGSMLDRKAE